MLDFRELCCQCWIGVLPDLVKKSPLTAFRHPPPPRPPVNPTLWITDHNIKICAHTVETIAAIATYSRFHVECSTLFGSMGGLLRLRILE